MSLDAMMTNDDAAEYVKLCSRINRVNKFSDKRLPLHFTGIHPVGAVQTHLMRNGYQKWPVRSSHEHFMELFEPGKLIYLTNESDNVVETLEHFHIYILEGLIDHNKHGKYFHHLAEVFDIRHARRSLFEDFIVNDSTALRIDHVLGMLLNMNAGKALKPSIKYVEVEANSDAPIVDLPLWQIISSRKK